MTFLAGVGALEVILGAIAATVVGFIWWAPLFGNQWAKLMGMSASDMKKAKQKGMAKPMSLMVLGNVIMAYVIAGLVVTTAMGAALTWAFWIWLGFVATTGVGIVLWQGKPWALFWLNSFGWLATILATTAVVVWI